MPYLAHIAACNAHEIGKFLPFLVARRHVGWVRHDTALRLAAFAEAFRVGDDAVTMHPALETPAERSAAVAQVARALSAEGGFRPRAARPMR